MAGRFGRALFYAAFAILWVGCTGGDAVDVIRVPDAGDGGDGGRDGGMQSDAGEDAPPTVRITTPDDGAMVASGTLRIEGEARDDRAVTTVLVRVGPNVAQRAHTDDNFKHFWFEAPVPQGSFQVSAVAVDSKPQTSDTATVQLTSPTVGSDAEAPTLTITSPEDGSTPAQALALVTGTASDDRAVVAIDVELNGEIIDERLVETDDLFATWARLVPLVPGQDNVLTFIARDALGNEGRASITLVGPVQTDRDPPTLSVAAPVDGDTLDAPTVTVEGAASDNIGVREVKVRVGVDGGGGTVTWGDYVRCTTADGFEGFVCEDVAVPSGDFDLQVKAIDLNGLVTAVNLSLSNDHVPEWTPEVALPLRLRAQEARPQLTVRLDREGIDEVISADIQRDTQLLALDTTTLLTSALNQIKNSCGTAWQNDSADPQHDCAAAFGPGWQTSPEYSVVRILTMTPANVVVEGTSIEALRDLADALGVGGGFRDILADTLGIPRTQEIVGTAALVQALQTFFMADHPAVLPGARLPVTLYDAMHDLNPLADTLGPSGEHPGIVDPSSPVQSEVFLDDFEMLLEAESNLRWKEGVDVAGASMTAEKEYIAVVNDEVGPSFDDVLEFDFNDPARFDIQGLAANPTVDLRFALQEAPVFVPACTAGANPCQGNTPSSPLTGYIWERPRWEAETVVAAGARYQYLDRDDYSRTYYIIVPAARVTVGAGSNPAGWTSFTTLLNLGDPPPDQYLWELINEVAQVALHNFGGTTLEEGEANAAFTLSDIDVGLSADQIREAVRPELQAQRAKLSEQLLGDYAQNNGAVDFYYDLGDDGAPYAFFVAESDPLPSDTYDYENPGFFEDAALTTKLSTTEPGSSGDDVHEKLALSEGETIAYVQDQDGSVHRLRFVVGDDTSEIQVFVSARAR